MKRAGKNTKQKVHFNYIEVVLSKSSCVSIACKWIRFRSHIGHLTTHYEHQIKMNIELISKWGLQMFEGTVPDHKRGVPQHFELRTPPQNSHVLCVTFFLKNQKTQRTCWKCTHVHMRVPPFSTSSGGDVNISCEHVDIFNRSFERNQSCDD